MNSMAVMWKAGQSKWRKLVRNGNVGAAVMATDVEAEAEGVATRRTQACNQTVAGIYRRRSFSWCGKVCLL
jgi:hypothetical protein